jgi:hypothetical protein
MCRKTTWKSLTLFVYLPIGDDIPGYQKHLHVNYIQLPELGCSNSCRTEVHQNSNHDILEIIQYAYRVNLKDWQADATIFHTTFQYSFMSTIRCFSRYSCLLSSDMRAYLPRRLGPFPTFAAPSVAVLVMSLNGERPADGCEELPIIE